MPKANWNDYDDLPAKGAIVFVVECDDTSNGRSYFEARSRPWVTNQSGEAKIKGWLGETNNKSRHALGRARITSTNDTLSKVGFTFLAGRKRWELTG